MKIGFIGVGNMGGPMCRNIIAKSGCEVTVFDLDASAVEACRKAGAKVAQSIGDLAATSDVIFTSLPTPAHIEAASIGPEGFARSAKPGTLYVDLSTNSPLVSQRIAARLSEMNVRMLEAPVSGGVAGATAGTIVVMAGGALEDFNTMRELFASFSAKAVYVGAVGLASVAKLVNNMIFACNLTAAFEGLSMAAAAGLDLEVLDSILTSASGDSAAYRYLAGKVKSGDYAPQFALDLAYKDVSLALDLATQQGVPSLMASPVISAMRLARAQGFGKSDVSAGIKVYAGTIQRPLTWGSSKP